MLGCVRVPACIVMIAVWPSAGRMHGGLPLVPSHMRRGGIVEVKWQWNTYDTVSYLIQPCRVDEPNPVSTGERKTIETLFCSAATAVRNAFVPFQFGSYRSCCIPGLRGASSAQPSSVQLLQLQLPPHPPCHSLTHSTHSLPLLFPSNSNEG